jgi:hypothetical protein
LLTKLKNHPVTRSKADHRPERKQKLKKGMIKYGDIWKTERKEVQRKEDLRKHD